ncbi:MAG: hypothetical protein MJZ66_03205 [Bacteroidales bacterium]|nr:hypothetical protein [Bacteroidales bacterium]MCQ2253262.1 hypothetical protein [Bacteroidales bacterium]
MKKLFFSLMALTLCAFVLVSCGKDDDDDDDAKPSFIASLTCNTNGKPFNGTAAAHYTKANDGTEDSKITGSTIKILDFFKTSDEKTTIYGYDKATGAFMSITFKGGKGFVGSVNGGVNATQLLIDYLQGGSISDALKGTVDAFVVYRSSKDESDKASMWFSTQCNINITINNTYINGTFSAKLMNSAKETMEITNGQISCLGF